MKIVASNYYLNTLYEYVTRHKNIRLGKILKQVSFVREDKII